MEKRLRKMCFSGFVAPGCLRKVARACIFLTFRVLFDSHMLAPSLVATYKKPS